MIFVLYVMSGSETDIVEELARRGIKGYAPRQERIIRRGGKELKTVNILFDGYVFVEMPEGFTADTYYSVCRIPGVVRYLSKTEWLSDGEAEYIRELNGNGEPLEVSRAHFEDGKLVVDDGLLLHYRGNIVKYDKRQSKVIVQTTLYGKPHRFTMAVEFT